MNLPGASWLKCAATSALGRSEIFAAVEDCPRPKSVSVGSLRAELAPDDAGTMVPDGNSTEARSLGATEPSLLNDPRMFRVAGALFERVLACVTRCRLLILLPDGDLLTR